MRKDKLKGMKIATWKCGICKKEFSVLWGGKDMETFVIKKAREHVCEFNNLIK